MLTIIPLIIIIIGVGVILVIVARHAPKAATLDVSVLPEEREAQLKSSILENRLLRKTDAVFKIVARLAGPLNKYIVQWYEKGRQRLRSLERAYRFQGALPDSTKKSERKARDIAEEANAALNSGNLSKAESLFLSCIKINPQFADGYKGLGSAYLKMREWEQARETFEYLTKTWPQDDGAFALLAQVELGQGNVDAAKDHFLHALSINNEMVDYHLGLAELYLARGDQEKALSSLQKAQALEPNNPRILDRLFQVCILVGNKQLGQEVLEKIQKVNPEHGKLKEFEKKIKEMK